MMFLPICQKSSLVFFPSSIFCLDNSLRAVRANQDVENANMFQMSGDFVYEVSSFVVSAAPQIDVLSMTLGSWHSWA